MLQTIRDFLAGKKTYITAVVGILTALIAWSGGELTDLQVIGAIWVALQVIFIRSGNKKDVQDKTNILTTRAVDEAYVLGYTAAQDSYSAGYAKRDSKDEYFQGFTDGFNDGEDYARYEDE